ncbi:alpha/beta fold hydrolase [Gryllotalpicola reticulitermitis]|uniref:Alpha/beta fold hydrolase n=1 Tax=Gryllotalpicola reticulitermitis TaxID=1184153 RepID=A0ABV8Q000_9MICO
MTDYSTHRVADLDLFVRRSTTAGPDAPTLVLLPGFPSSSAQYEGLIARLADDANLIAPDYPGFGHSQTPPTGDFTYTFDHLAGITEQLLLEELGLDRLWLYMFDFGAPVGFRIATRHPEKIAGLIIQNGNAYEAGLGPMMDIQRDFWADRNGVEPSIRELLTLPVTRAQYFDGAGRPEAINPDAPLLDQLHMEEPNRKDAFVDLLFDYQSNTAHYPEWQAYLRENQPPTLITWGANDQFFTAEGARAYLTDLPNAELHLLNGGHFASAEYTDDIAHHIHQFLATHR